MKRTEIAAAGIALAAAGLAFALLRSEGGEGGDTNDNVGAANESADAQEPSTAPSPERQGTYADELRALDAAVKTTEARAGTRDSSMDFERAADARMERARLTGDYADYTAAEQLVTKAAAHAPEGAGPFMTRARLNFTLHRMATIEDDLQRAEGKIILPDPERAAIVGLRGAMQLEQGRYAEARKNLARAHELSPSPTTLSRLALYEWKTGQHDAADALFAEAAKRFHGRSRSTRAWFDLQRGLLDLDRERYDDALAHYEEAARILSGWWLIEEHMAEIHALKGDLPRARALYEDLVARTGNPELMDALAEVLARQGEQERAQQLVARAAAAYEERLQRHPEASMGHALEHFIAHAEPARYVPMAERNRDLRPGGDAAVLLAAAYLQAGRKEDARATIALVEATPFRSLSFHQTAADVYDAVGDGARAAAHRAEGKALAVR